MLNNISKIKTNITKASIIKTILLLLFLYVFIMGVLIFIKPKKISNEYIKSSSTSSYYSDDIGPDRGILIDDPLESGMARLKIIDNAKETLDIAYFSIDSGESPNLFFGALIDAADRGVKVNLLLDGLFHGLKGEFKPIIYAFINHPNMTLKFYEPFNPLMPWTLNNRMHDKYIIADNNIAIIGGRNIGDKYFAPEWHTKSITNDRDIIIFNSKPDDLSSVIFQMTDYFNNIWEHKFSKTVDYKLSKTKQQRATKKTQELKEKSMNLKQANKNLFEKPIDLMEISFPTNKVSFICNPIERFSKEPWCWYEITQLMMSAKNSIFVQSPYVVPNRQMTKGFINPSDFEGIDVAILTNSIASSPNFPAYSGYLNHKKAIIKSGVNVFEFQSQDSLHTKSFIIDDNLLAIGSFNSDPRSTYLSTESMIVVHSSEAVKKIEEGIMDYIDQSLLVSKDYTYLENSSVDATPASFTKRFTIKLLSFIAIFFEYML